MNLLLPLYRNINYGRLWVHIDANMRDTFLDNLDSNIALGDARWKEWWGDLNAGPFNTECFSAPDDTDGSGYNVNTYVCPVPIPGVTEGGNGAEGMTTTTVR